MRWRVREGALGGKITGAGGGGYMLLYCRFDRKHAIRERMAGLGVQMSEVSLEPLGLQTWRVNDTAGRLTRRSAGGARSSSSVRAHASCRGISVYTVRLANALADAGHTVNLLTMRRLIPARLYPGWKRVGADLTILEPRPGSRPVRRCRLVLAAEHLPRSLVSVPPPAPDRDLRVVDGDGRSFVHRARHCSPACWAPRSIIEFHEIVAVEEAGHAPGWALRANLRATLLQARPWLRRSFRVRPSAGARDMARWARRRPLEVLPHGPHDHYQPPRRRRRSRAAARSAPARAINLLFFGVIRPYKGLRHLVEAFEQIPEAEIDDFWLTVVGETWEGYTHPIEMIERSARAANASLSSTAMSPTPSCMTT